MYKFFTQFVFLFLFCFANLVYGDNSALVFEDEWIAEAPPGAKVMVAYLTLKNTGAEELEIIKAKAELFSSIEFHQTLYEDGMAKMIRHSSLVVPANSTLQLKRGGKHLMLFNPARQLKAGDHVRLTFTLKDNSDATIIIEVKKAQY